MLKKIILGIVISAIVLTTSAGFLYAYQKESGIKHNFGYKNNAISKNANDKSNNISQNYTDNLNNQNCENCINNKECNTDCYQYRFSQTSRNTQRLQNNQLNKQNNGANCFNNENNNCYENQNCYVYRYNNKTQIQSNNCNELNQQNMLRNRIKNNQ